MCGPDDDVLLPPESAQVDWEAELAVVIGATARRVPRERALDYVAGYTVCNDISARDLQFPAEHRPLGGDWIRAKNCPTFLPTGPFLVSADQVGDHRDLEITFDHVVVIRDEPIPQGGHSEHRPVHEANIERLAVSGVNDDLQPS